MKVQRGEACYTKDEQGHVIRVTPLDLAPKGWWVQPVGQQKCIERSSLHLFPTAALAELWTPAPSSDRRS